MLNHMIMTFKRHFKWQVMLTLQLVFISLFVFFVMVYATYQKDYKDSERISVGLINEDTSPMSSVIIDSFRNNTHFTGLFQLTLGSKEMIQSGFDQGSLHAFVLIPEGFSSALIHYENIPLQVTTHADHPTKNRILVEALTSYGAYVKAADLATLSLYETLKADGMSQADLTKANEQFSIEMISATMGRQLMFDVQTTSDMPLVTANSYFIMALPLALFALMTIQNGLQLIDDLKRTITHRLMVASQPLWQLSLGSLIGQLLVVLCYFFPLFGMLFWQVGPALALSGSLLLVIGILVWSIFWRLLALLVKHEQAFSLFASLMGLSLAIVGGGFMPFVVLPPLLKQVGSLTPIYHLTRTFLTLSTGGPIPLGPLYGLLAFVLIGLLIEQLLLLQWLKREV